MQFELPILALATAVAASPLVPRALAPTVTLSHATVVGSSNLVVDSFKGIPFALPPVASLRLKPPQAITTSQGTIMATGTPSSCPQMFVQANTTSLPDDVAAEVLSLPIAQAASGASEDCLTLNVQRPSTATAGSKLPVVFWIFGGGFEVGSTSMYDGTQFITNSISQGKPVIFVAVNYRLGGFGWLGGKEILADGSGNLGLLDQRLGLQWVADNIAQFGGDPSKVTIWGESAGSISVLDQMILYNGNNTYKGSPLFRGAIMDSGSIVPADPVNCTKAQAVYDQVVTNAGCSGSADTLNCLRGVSYQTYLNAVNSLPGIFSYDSVALAYLPRPDYTALAQSPELLVGSGKIAKVPFIIGDQQDEGTLFSLTQSNITTTAQLQTYLQTVFFNDASSATIAGLLEVYPDDPTQGSPFGTGILYNIYPQYKRLAAILGDLTFTLTRRAFLNLATAAEPSVPSWSYLASYGHAIPILGTFHGTDLLSVFGTVLSFPQETIQSYYYSFINTLDPNNGTSSAYPTWPRWSTTKQLVNFNATANGIISDTFRTSQYNFLAANTASFRI